MSWKASAARLLRQFGSPVPEPGCVFPPPQFKCWSTRHAHPGTNATCSYLCPMLPPDSAIIVISGTIVALTLAFGLVNAIDK